jgi:hypothetical protein
LFSSFVFAQALNSIPREADVRGVKDGKNKKRSSVVENKTAKIQLNFNKIQGTIDTLSYRKSFGEPAADWDNGQDGFGMAGQDQMTIFYEAPADLIIKAVGFACSENANGDEVTVKIVKPAYSKEDFAVGAATQWGWYPQAGDGFNEITPWPDEATGEWVPEADAPIQTPMFLSDEPNYDLWSDGGFGWPITPVVTSSSDPEYQWIVLNETLGFEAEVASGEIFGISITHSSAQMDDGSDGNRIAFWSNDGSGGTGPTPYYWNAKHYENGRTQPDLTTAGLWSRTFILDYVAIVDLVGDKAPDITDVTEVSQTIFVSEVQTISATITDSNPSGGNIGVQGAVLYYSLDGGDTVAVSMTASGDVYSGDLPAPGPGVSTSFWIEATDVEGNIASTLPKSFTLYAVQNPVLLLYNGDDYGAGTITFYWTLDWLSQDGNPIPYDYWDSGELGAEKLDVVINDYTYIIQLDGSYPNYDLGEKIMEFLGNADADNPKFYFLSSQDYGCELTGDCSDTSFAAGDWQYDYLGINGIVSQDFGGMVQLTPAGGDPLTSWVEQVMTDSGTTLWYDPARSLGITPWIDGLSAVEGGNAAVIMTGSDGTQEIPVGIRNNGDNFATAYITYDYAGTDFRSDTSLAYGDDPKSIWGPNLENTLGSFFAWTGYDDLFVGVENLDKVPSDYSLAQNYPNPFNPTTSIEFSIPRNSVVNLKIYNTLGQEVATLINGQMNAGSYNYDFDASNLSSGVYIYTLKAGDFVQTRKMMLLK